jgi:hypothetical protein
LAMFQITFFTAYGTTTERLATLDLATERAQGVLAYEQRPAHAYISDLSNGRIEGALSLLLDGTVSLSRF